MANLLLISNSTNAGEAYLEYAMPHIEAFLKKHNAKSALFVPYAGVTISWDNYFDKVKQKFDEIGVDVCSIHTAMISSAVIDSVDAIIVGGGNTFNLLKNMQLNYVIESIRRNVIERGKPYIGWSAGSVVACPTMCTTNDMPIVEPRSFEALALIPFQINPHYSEVHPEGHAGETRQMRIAEYIELNRDTTVVGLREGTMLEVEGSKVTLIGDKTAKIFNFSKEPVEVSGSLDDLIK